MMPSTRFILHPLPPNIYGKAVIIVDLILLSITSFSFQVSPWLACTALAVIAVAAAARDVQSFHLSLFTALLIAVPCLRPELRSWPYALLIPILCYSVIVLAVPGLRHSLLWFRAGVFDRSILLSVVSISVVSGLALIIWYAALKPDLSIQLRNMPEMPGWLFPIAGLAFSAGNAFMEEFAFRGIVMQSTDSIFGAGFVSVLMQAWLFGAMHFLQGFPRGLLGVAMTAAYGVMLGMVRRRSRGMLAPWAAHVFADLVIFSILSLVVLKG